MAKYKNLYDTLTENNELLKLFPELKRKDIENSWENDKKLFTKINEEQETFLNETMFQDEE
jgi:uncharacterized protein (DUF433 family)